MCNIEISARSDLLVVEREIVEACTRPAEVLGDRSELVDRVHGQVVQFIVISMASPAASRFLKVVTAEDAALNRIRITAPEFEPCV